MYGGLLKSASALAIVAAASLYGASPVKAADLGGDCCADLEERVAELEATTVRKGNRKVSLAISGFVSHNVIWWDDGTQQDMYIGDGGNYGSRFRFTGTAKISPQVTAGFLYEWQSNANGIQTMNQLNGGDDLGSTIPGGATANQAAGSVVLRDSTVWLRHSQLGMVKVGHGSTATDNLTLIDLGGTTGAATSDVALYNGGFILRSNAGLLGAGGSANVSLNWAQAIRGHESWDTSRRNHVLYETPSLVGFTVQAAVAEDNYWDVALRYAGEFGGFRLAGGIGYQQDTEFNAGAQLFNAGGALCATACDVKVTDLKGSASILHVGTGLFLTGAGGRREIEGSFTTNPAVTYSGPDLTFWYLAGGISQNFFGIGKTVLFGEYSVSKGGLEQGAFLATTTGYNTNEGGAKTSSEVTHWGLGVTQHVDAAAMEVFATYKNYSLDATGFTGANVTLNKGSSGVSDIQAVIVGTRINF
jgi:Gram-negative porin